MTQLTVHDVPREVWDALRVQVRGGEGIFWKTIDTPSVRIVIFAPLDQAGDGGGALAS